MSSSPALSAAVIGLGGMGRRHLLALAETSIAAVAVCDSSEAALNAVDGSARRYLDWQQLLACEARSLDLVIVATNGPSHHSIVTAAASAGVRHILCEKPMATSGAKARAMAHSCKEAGSRFAVNLSRRFSDRYVHLRMLLCQGAIGRLVHVNVSVGAGGLGCIGTHYFDLVSWLTDAPAAWVAGEIDSNPPPNVRGPHFFDPGGRGLVGYENGMTASFQLSGDSAICPLVQVIGTDGFVDLDGWSPPNSGRVDVYARPAAQRGAPKTKFVQPEKIAFDPGPAVDVVASARSCIEDLVGKHREQTVAPAIAAVDTVIAFHLSSRRGGARIRLPLSGVDLDYDVPMT